jgi:hypothetical protein
VQMVKKMTVVMCDFMSCKSVENRGLVMNDVMNCQLEGKSHTFGGKER